MSPQIEAIEEAIGSGQVEELIEIAKDELELIPLYACEWRGAREAAAWREWEEPMAAPEDDSFADLYDQLYEIDPEKLRAMGVDVQSFFKRE